ncbi:MAG: protein kinase [Anaerolineae bacterium]|nr:protein kinase [Anaerolineae bacterium]
MSTIINHRYLIMKTLGKGGMGVVHLALDRLTGETVALKQVLVGGITLDMPNTAGHDLRVALSREFKVLAGLRHPNIISVLDYGFDQDGQPFFTMEFLEKAQYVTIAGDDVAFEVKVDLLAQALQALVYLHRVGLLHRDLKPENMLVTEGRLRLLDFGLSVTSEQIDEHETSGTLAYIAPEVLTGAPASQAADLYAVGLIAWELFTGSFPYDTSSTALLINEIINHTPYADDVEDELHILLQQLIAKNPELRPHSAYAALQHLEQIVRQSLLQESAAIRESFLRAAPFIGRDTELTALLKELNGLKQQQGTLWLIGGESGIGKSRLLDELRTHALVDGIQVLRGQEKQEAGSPYTLWRDIVRRLSLMVNLSDMQVSILKAIAPDIGPLLQRTVPDAPPLEGHAAQDRLFTVIEAMFNQCSFPLLLLLEDLHWSDNTSLMLLNRMQRVIRQRPILIVATYREDERPDLAANFLDGQTLRLRRMDDRHIRLLITAMLGDAAHDAHLVSLLAQESGGNVFFLIEVLRALSEQSGGLASIQSSALRGQIFAGGIQEIIQRRLSVVGPEDRELLHLAAVGGRQVDLAVLRQAVPSASLDFWLVTCTSLGILEVDDARWRFASNRFRSGILATLDEATLKTLHRRIAHAIEAIYPDGGGQAAALGQHYEAAGDAVAAGSWYFLAGREAREAYVPEAAIEHFQKALHYLPDTADYRQQRLQALAGLGQMLRWQTRFDEASEVYSTMQRLAATGDDPLLLAQALAGLDDVENSRGNRQAALAYAEQAEAAARAAGEPGLPELVNAMSSRAWSLYRLKQREEALTVAREALALAEVHHLTGFIARNLSLIGIVHSMADRLDEAVAYMQRALEVTRTLGDRRDLGIKLNNLGELYRMRSELPAALKHYEEAVSIFRDIGYRDAELALLTNIGSVHLAQGHPERALEPLQQVIDLTGGKDWWGLGEAWLTLARAYLFLEHYLEALEAGQHGLAQGQITEDAEIEGRAWRIVGRAASRLMTEVTVAEATFSPVQCFEKSLAFYGDNTPGRAYTLKAWAIHAQEEGQAEESDRLWQQAETIFIQHRIFDPLDE